MKFLACINKEIRILWRDRAGLVILLVMPIALATIVTLVQEDAFSQAGKSATRILVMDDDGGPFADELIARLEGTDEFVVVRKQDEAPNADEAAQAATAAAAYPVALVLPAGCFDQARMKARALLDPEFAAAAAPSPRVRVYFDPAVRDTFRRSILHAFGRVLDSLESEILFTELRRELEALSGGEAHPSGTEWKPGELLTLDTASADTSAETAYPTSVQQNVPAWALFAMFLVVVPLSGAMIKERECGVLTRLRSFPSSSGAIITAKLTMYVGVCLLQLLVMAALGRFAFPFLGLPAFAWDAQFPALVLVSFSSALAATGFGLLIAVLARTHEQASVFGATSVVIMAALGGIMVPVFLMPSAMRALSVFSPLHWGHSAFLDLFLRNAGLADIAGDVLKLLVFSVATVGVALICLALRQPE